MLKHHVLHSPDLDNTVSVLSLEPLEATRFRIKERFHSGVVTFAVRQSHSQTRFCREARTHQPRRRISHAMQKKMARKMAEIIWHLFPLKSAAQPAALVVQLSAALSGT